MKKKIIIISVIIVLVIAVIIGYFSFSDLIQTVTLRKEVTAIGNIDITKDDIDMTIKTKGNYAIVEETIKQYMNSYSINCKEVMNIMEDKKLQEILTAENYKNDGPEFTISKEYINTTRLNFNEKINLLIDMLNEEKMMEAIKNKNLSDNFIQLYNELMLGDEIKVDLKETADSLKQTSNSMNNILDIQEKVINLLINNKGKWEIVDDKIQFQTQKLVNEYNDLIGNL